MQKLLATNSFKDLHRSRSDVQDMDRLRYTILKKAVYVASSIFTFSRFVLSLDKSLIRARYVDTNSVQALGLSAGFGALIGPISIISGLKSANNGRQIHCSMRVTAGLIQVAIGVAETIGGAAIFFSRAFKLIETSSISAASKSISTISSQIGSSLFSGIYLYRVYASLSKVFTSDQLLTNFSQALLVKQNEIKNTFQKFVFGLELTPSDIDAYFSNQGLTTENQRVNIIIEEQKEYLLGFISQSTYDKVYRSAHPQSGPIQNYDLMSITIAINSELYYTKIKEIASAVLSTMSACALLAANISTGGLITYGAVCAWIISSIGFILLDGAELISFLRNNDLSEKDKKMLMSIFLSFTAIAAVSCMMAPLSSNALNASGTLVGLFSASSVSISFFGKKKNHFHQGL